MAFTLVPLHPPNVLEYLEAMEEVYYSLQVSLDLQCHPGLEMYANEVTRK